MNRSKSLEAPVFFTSASRVKIPFVGDDTRKVRPFKNSYFPVTNPLEKHHNQIANHFVKSVSEDVKFDLDVVKERSAHLLPYKEADTAGLFDASDIIQFTNDSRDGYSGRFDTRGYNRKLPGHLKKLHLPNASQRRMTKKKVIKSIKAVTENGETSTTHDLRSKSRSTHAPTEETFLTEVLDSSRSDMTEEDDVLYLSKLPPSKGLKRRRRPKFIPVNDWDELILDQLSKDTARWIVFESLSSGKQKEKLDKFVRQKYGQKVSSTHLVREEVSDSDLAVAQKRKEDKKKVQELRKLKEKEEISKELHNDALLQQTVAQYYKLPRYLKQQISRAISTSSEVNQSAQEIKVKHMRPSPPPKMQDFLNPNAGKYIKTTDNEFEQQLYTGQAKPVHQVDGDNSRIIMDDLSEYQNKLQTKYPPDPQQWSKDTKSKKHKPRLRKGLQRWSSLPEPADFMSERGLNPPTTEKTKFEDIEINRHDQMQDNISIITIIEEWRSKWKIAGRWQEVTLAEIMIDMDSIHRHIRLAAVTICAMAALHRMPVTDIAVLAVLPKMGSMSAKKCPAKGHLPEPLLNKVKQKLSDKMGRVRLAAAMCLYTLEDKEKEEIILKILNNNLQEGNIVDRLAAAQCLALNGSVSSTVIKALMDLLLGYDSSTASPLVQSQQEQATTLLVNISEKTRLVHSLLAEQLNSSNWKDRALSCNVLSKLYGNINKDLVHKLTNLMWDDWSSGVRKAAAQALGKTGHGRDVHFQLRDKLITGNERIRVNVLKMIAHLGIMTASLLPAFMKCFKDEYISVRLEACHTTAKLKIADKTVLSELIQLMQYDAAWKIKAYAIKAIAEIRLINEKAHDALVWAVRFEDEPGVRMEACAALRALLKPETVKNEVISVLQDRVLVEPDPAVKDEVRLTLEVFGMSGPEDNMDMIQQIKNEVKRLCNKSIIAGKITLYEQELEKYRNKAHYMGDFEDNRTKKESRMSSRNTELQDIAQSLPSTPKTKYDYTPRTQPKSQVQIVLPNSATPGSLGESSYLSELNIPTPQETPLPSTPKTPNRTMPTLYEKGGTSSPEIGEAMKTSDTDIKAKSTQF